MQYEDFHLGLDTKYDFKKVKSLLAQAAYSHCGLYYAQFDILKNAFILGSSFNCQMFKGAKHALQVTYTKDGAKGI